MFRFLRLLLFWLLLMAAGWWALARFTPAAAQGVPPAPFGLTVVLAWETPQQTDCRAYTLTLWSLAGLGRKPFGVDSGSHQRGDACGPFSPPEVVR